MCKIGAGASPPKKALRLKMFGPGNLILWAPNVPILQPLALPPPTPQHTHSPELTYFQVKVALSKNI